jgi:hypothetical protein
MQNWQIGCFEALDQLGRIESIRVRLRGDG